ncbi:MAG: hypothetical protein ABI700_20170 [Chloroflexota bacterium]
MWRKSLLYLGLMLVLAILLMLVASLSAFAQETTETPGDPTATLTPAPVMVTHTEPGQFINGQAGILSVFGANFTSQTTVRLVGLGLLDVTLVNSGALTAVLPTDLPPGQYGIEVSAPGAGTAVSPNNLTVSLPPLPLPTAAPPTEVPTAFPTLPAPTPIPGQPSLIVRDFAAIPSVVAQGGPVALTFVLLNQGNRAAQGVSVSLDSGGKFFPANGQAGVPLPDMPPGSSVQVTLNAMAARDAAEGPNSIPLTMTYRDFEGKPYTDKANLSVGVVAVNEISQVTLTRYQIDPQTPAPGDAVTVHVTVSNTGNKTASRVLLRVSGDKNILLAGEQGDSFPLGDIEPNGNVSVDLPMLVNPAAEAGPQSQPITLSYMQEATDKTATTSMTIEIARVVRPEALILLDNYSIGDKDTLTPGDRFTLSMTLRNVGQADAPGALLIFGTVDAPPATGSGGDSGSGSGSGTGSGATSSGAFAPLGAGDTLYLGTLAAGGQIDLKPEFIVNSTVTSGIYSLPITVRYQKADGTTAQQNLRASVIVIEPLRVQTSLVNPIPDSVNVGEPFPFAVKISNQGATTFNVSEAEVTGENVEIVDGATKQLSPLKADKDTTITAAVMPSAEGKFTITLTLTYTDVLNRTQTMVLSYDGQAVAPPPPPDIPQDIPTPPPVAQEEENLLGRLLLGFLGLGG